MIYLLFYLLNTLFSTRNLFLLWPEMKSKTHVDIVRWVNYVLVKSSRKLTNPLVPSNGHNWMKICTPFRTVGFFLPTNTVLGTYDCLHMFHSGVAFHRNHWKFFEYILDHAKWIFMVYTFFFISNQTTTWSITHTPTNKHKMSVLGKIVHKNWWSGLVHYKLALLLLNCWNAVYLWDGVKTRWMFTLYLYGWIFTNRQLWQSRTQNMLV